MIECAGFSGGPLRKVAAIICFVGAGIAQKSLACRPMKGHAGVPMGLEDKLAVRAVYSGGGDGAIASRTSSHSQIAVLEKSELAAPRMAYGKPPAVNRHSLSK